MYGLVSVFGHVNFSWTQKFVDFLPCAFYTRESELDFGNAFIFSAIC